MIGEAMEVLVPMLNPNEPEAVVVSVAVIPGQAVGAGDVLCVLETTKSTEEVLSPAGGFVVGWTAAAGDTVTAGRRLCWVAASADWTPPADTAQAADMGSTDGWLPEGLRISQPALAMARERGVDLSDLPIGPMVTKAVISELLLRAVVGGAATIDAANAHDPGGVFGDDSVPGVQDKPGVQDDRGRRDVPADEPDGAERPERVRPIHKGVLCTSLVIYGAGGHGQTLADLIETVNARPGPGRPGMIVAVLAFVDQGLEPGTRVEGTPVLGGDDILDDLLPNGVMLAANGVGGIARPADRVAAHHRLVAAGLALPVLVHPSAVVEPTAQMGDGCQILARAYVGSSARLGAGCLVNTAAVVSHGCHIGDHVNLSPGCLLAGDVTVGEGALFGMGVTVNLGVTVGPGARIGNSAVIKSDVPAGSIVRAGSVWPPA
ncbi:MAG: biotin/lipoyl-containing protein [Acidimicrobiales bacterium]